MRQATTLFNWPEQTRPASMRKSNEGVLQFVRFLFSSRPMGTGIGGWGLTPANAPRSTSPMPTAQPIIVFQSPSISDLKPGRSLAFEHCAAQVAGRTLILMKNAVATPHPTAVISTLHFAARDVLGPTAGERRPLQWRCTPKYSFQSCTRSDYLLCAESIVIILRGRTCR